jgi:hypothetical protein
MAMRVKQEWRQQHMLPLPPLEMEMELELETEPSSIRCEPEEGWVFYYIFFLNFSFLS